MFKYFNMNLCIMIKKRNLLVSVIFDLHVVYHKWCWSLPDRYPCLKASTSISPLGKIPTLTLYFSFCVCFLKFNTYFCIHLMYSTFLHIFHIVEIASGSIYHFFFFPVLDFSPLNIFRLSQIVVENGCPSFRQYKLLLFLVFLLLSDFNFACITDVKWQFVAF